MYKYPEERKQAILKKLAPPYNMTVADVAAQEGISSATLYNWRSNARKAGAIMPSNAASPDAWSSEDKFKAVMETYSLTEAELSEYCRKKAFILSSLSSGVSPAFKGMPQPRYSLNNTVSHSEKIRNASRS